MANTFEKLKCFCSKFRLYNRLKYIRYSLRSRRAKFAEIYKNNGFGGKHAPLSGTGSTLIQTQSIKEELPELLNDLNIKSLLDAACGDFNWMREVDLGHITYLGIDIVAEVIENNTNYYSSDRIKFVEMDIVTCILPKADIILCRDCFVHLSNKDILKAVANFKKSRAAYLLTTTFKNLKENKNLVSARGWRPINLECPPFNFPQPLELINERCTEANGRYADKCLGLWLLNDL